MTYLKTRQEETRGPSVHPTPRKKRRRNALCEAMLPPTITSFVDTIRKQENDLSALRKSLRSWDFNIFDSMRKYSVMNQGNVLPLISTLIFDDMSEELESIGVDTVRLKNYMQKINEKYRNNPFHNSIHGADVGQTVYALLCDGTWHRTLSTVDKLALLVAAFSHDVGHNGDNNQFLINSDSNLALRYGSESLLEKMHLCIAWDALQSENCSFLNNMSQADRKRFAHVFKISILGTDNAKHFEKLNALNALIESEYASKSIKVQGNCRDKNLDLILELIVHAADISNPAKSYLNGPYKVWCDKIMEEFYALGDKEHRFGLPVTEIFKRGKPVKDVQIGFTKVFVRPLFAALEHIEGLQVGNALIKIDQNLEYWYSLGTSKK